MTQVTELQTVPLNNSGFKVKVQVMTDDGFCEFPEISNAVIAWTTEPYGDNDDTDFVDPEDYDDDEEEDEAEAWAPVTTDEDEEGEDAPMLLETAIGKLTLKLLVTANVIKEYDVYRNMDYLTTTVAIQYFSNGVAMFSHEFDSDDIGVLEHNSSDQTDANAMYLDLVMDYNIADRFLLPES